MHPVEIIVATDIVDFTTTEGHIAAAYKIIGNELYQRIEWNCSVFRGAYVTVLASFASELAHSRIVNVDAIIISKHSISVCMRDRIA